MTVSGEGIGQFAQASLLNLFFKLTEQHVLFIRMIKQGFSLFDGLTQEFRECLLRVRIILQILLNHFGHTGFNDVGFVASFILTPVFWFLGFPHIPDIVRARWLAHLNTHHMLINELFHFLSVFVVIHSLTGRFLNGLAQRRHAFHCLFIVAAIFIAEASVFKEGHRLQRHFQATGEGH